MVEISDEDWKWIASRLNDRPQIAKELAELSEYRDLGPIDRLRELAEADKDGRCVVLPCKVETLMERYNALKFPTGDEAETYSTGYRNGHKNGQAELLEYLLGIDTGERSESAEAALKEGDTP